MTRGTKQAFVVESDPVGADVTMSNGMTCKTPCALKVKRKDAFVVKINKPGYEPVEANIQSQMSGAGGAALAGNVILGGLIGAGVDAATGATKELKPNPLKVVLTPLSPAAAAAAASATAPASVPSAGDSPKR
ncbi:PEGA domain-containing protein [Sphingomonas mesophila]|uniref:PEGA domain-containing protein n=1 Tax=Sphingomonas mesophila TaxID=2303576 RepID=UPI00196878FA|nr:PEGA domain-containing protein [Sphingomonas mesophila]